MFIRQKSNNRVMKKKEVVPKEQPLLQPEIDVAEVAAQKIEEVMNMAPASLEVEEAIAFVSQACEEECAEEPAEPIGEAESAQDFDDEVSSSDEGDTTE